MLVGTYNTNSSIHYFDKNKMKHYKLSDIKNPSFLHKIGINGKIFIFSVSEKINGELFSYELLQNNNKYELRYISSIKTHGSDPCHICTNDKYVFVSNYSSGSLSVIKYNTLYEFENVVQCIKYDGKSICEIRQTQSHIHSSILSHDKTQLFVADLGCDKIYVYNIIDYGDNILELIYETKTPDKYGPRHFCLHPEFDILYCICELSNKILMLIKNDEKFIIKNEISVIEEEMDKIITSAEIKFHKNKIYCTVRGTNKLVQVLLDKNTGNFLKNNSYINTNGETPRHFNIKDDDIYIANQKSNKIVLLSENKIYDKIKNPSYILLL